MRDVDDLCVNHPAETLLHCEIEGLDWDMLWHDVHRDAQVLHCCKTIADIYCKGIITLKKKQKSLLN